MTTAHDEVCGMSIDIDNAAARLRFQGKMYYFCSQRCRGMFEEHPDRYVPIAPDEDGTADGDDHPHHH